MDSILYLYAMLVGEIVLPIVVGILWWKGYIVLEKQIFNTFVSSGNSTAPERWQSIVLSNVSFNKIQICSDYCIIGLPAHIDTGGMYSSLCFFKTLKETA